MSDAFEFDYLVFIGRFQPFHQGHQHVVQLALNYAKQVIILVGSANSPRTPKNPFTASERTAMILGSFAPTDAARIHCVGIHDATYNDNKWLIGVQKAITDATASTINPKIAIIGHAKDDSSYYLALFPQYGSFMVDNYNGLSATPLRHVYFGDDLHAYHTASAVLTDTSRAFLDAFRQTDHYANLKREFDHIHSYQDAWRDAPYPPSFITADAVVVQSGHILLIERGGEYGRGLYALPGGFVDNTEDFYHACVRELIEETCIDIDKNILKNSLVSSQLFDAPKRSARARTVTMAYYFELPSNPNLPNIKASDDARRAFWLPLSQLDASQMFEDHYGVICRLLGI
ncbi:bifunctional nicotinamide-nucleotide adenylyltransferase/Nudix hydroxylase [uncultured Moraxella sp.]|uniref:bifunctional nicotinamide-nucleotide adenylyltransferase/Nudix hydroxylase n=1 Tax=uncultured Moraxella sp. TaxID=263769 RepID=UPI0025D0460F|nr:bifunctional nicotinamide-nucleotide adenylyltransferase/Nudix hydroxylase [uncultured Moraxella sp.]